MFEILAAMQRVGTSEKYLGPSQTLKTAPKLESVVASSPLTRSSYHAGDDFAKMKAAREAKLAQAR